MVTGVRSTSRRAWDAIRHELLHSRLCDLSLEIEGSPIEPWIERLYRELSAKGLPYLPPCYLTDGWGCPDRVPVIGLPFYLASPWLSRLEEERTGEIEDDRTVMMLLRHEAGHAINYAFRLWEEPDWSQTFGSFWKPYRESFEPQPFSRRFVRHIESSEYGRNYAQKHPDEDFAETFAVWLTPNSAWRRRYRGWPALRKLEYVDDLMRRVRRMRPLCDGGSLFRPVQRMTLLVKEHYGDGADGSGFHGAAYAEAGARRNASGVRRKARRRPRKGAARRRGARRRHRMGM
ncbi:MAG: putative zinc-binding metallopeptidase [Planctomycetes bacterium]|nr:putative zinc-binding metallopeptidase [Planctomycetota bacterium]